MVQVMRECQRSNETKRKMLGKKERVGEGKKKEKKWGMGGPKVRIEKEQKTFFLSTDRLVVRCCNRLTSQPPTRGDKWPLCVTDNTIHTQTVTHTHSQTCTWRSYRYMCRTCACAQSTETTAQESKSAAEWRAAESEREQEVTERAVATATRASDENCLISGWTVRYPGWFPKDVLVSPVDHWNSFTWVIRMWLSVKAATVSINTHTHICRERSSATALGCNIHLSALLKFNKVLLYISAFYFH